MRGVLRELAAISALTIVTSTIVTSIVLGVLLDLLDAKPSLHIGIYAALAGVFPALLIALMLESGTAFRLGDLVKSLQTTRTLSDELLDQLSTTSAEVDELARKASETWP
jgi:hypothetical protein